MQGGANTHSSPTSWHRMARWGLESRAQLLQVLALTRAGRDLREVLCALLSSMQSPFLPCAVLLFQTFN